MSMTGGRVAGGRTENVTRVALSVRPPIARARARRRTAVCAYVCLLVLATPAAAQTPGVTAARATAFIRVVGDLEVSRPDRPGGERLQESNIELSTGSGALISPVGHVLTAAHVVTVESGPMTVGGIRVEVKQTVRRIEVLLPADESAGMAPASFEATVVAVDAALDLAVLTVNSANLPFLDLGDSDAAMVGDAVEAVGFPFGEQVDIARPRPAVPVAPAASVSKGNVSAFRSDAQGARRFLQVTAALNAGNSGGPIVDAEGYLVGIANSVMRSRGSGATGVGFGVAVNLAKRFLESYGLDAVLRARRVALGPPSLLEGKALRLPLPVGLTDVSPLRTRVDTGPNSLEGLTLRGDRVVSPWPASRVADALVSGRAFERFSSSTAAAGAAPAPAGRVLLGHATGVMEDGTPARLEYGIVDLGSEKVVVRVIGPPYQLAYNASVLRAALQQLEADPLRRAGQPAAGAITWAARRASSGTPVDGVPVPAGWVAEAAGPLACEGLPSPSDAVTASPPTDFTIALRAGFIPRAPLAARDAASACGAAGGDESAYSSDFSFLGVRYHLEGRFRAVGTNGLLQLEWVAPADQAPAVSRAIGDWLAR